MPNACPGWGSGYPPALWRLGRGFDSRTRTFLAHAVTDFSAIATVNAKARYQAETSAVQIRRRSVPRFHEPIMAERETMTNNELNSTDSGASAINDEVKGINTVPEPSRDLLSERELVDYAEHRTQMLKWALALGKNPEKAKGYAKTTVDGYAYRLDLFYRWVWQEYDGYTTAISHDHADDFVQHLVHKDSSEEDKASHVKAIKMLFRWRAWDFDEDADWEPSVTFSSGNASNTNPPDFLSKDERQQVREAVLEHGSVPSYSNLDPEERDRWKAHLAQRFEKPKSEVTPDDFERANGWKWPSLIWTALDTGLRPIEVKRANVRWVDVKNKVLRIPKEESSKNRDNWIVSITDRTAAALQRWLNERETYEKYDDSDALWLNRNGNRYQHYSLNRRFRDLCEVADIPTENRDLTFYSIRHSVATYMAREEGLAAAQSQLRHKSEQTTMRYDQTPIEDLRDALNKIG